VGETHNELSGSVTGPAVLAGHIGTMNLVHAVPSALDGLPPADREFTGREDLLSTLADALRPGSDGSPVVVSALSGLPGVGKTALAVRAAHDALAAGWFPGGVLFVNLQGYDGARFVRPETALASFLRALGVPEEHVPPDTGGMAALYRSRLGELAKQRRAVLVVLDNASSTEQVKPLLPGSPLHRVVVTSRHFLGDLGSSRIMDLSVLEPDEAVALIANTLRTRRPDDERTAAEPEAARELTRLCGHLPLALAVVAALLATDPEQPISELAGALRESPARLDELSYGDTRSITRAFSLSYARLAPDQARLFRLLSLNPGQQVSVEAAAALADVPVPRARRLLGALRTAHVIEPGRPRGWFRFHDLVRLFAEERLREEDPPEETQAALVRLLEYYRDALRAAKEHVTGGTDGFARALEWTEIERPNLVAAVRLAHDRGRYEIALPLATDLSRFVRAEPAQADWLLIGEAALDSARHLGDTAGEAEAQTSMGDAARRMGALTHAAHRYGLALALHRELGDRPGQARLLHRLGTVARLGGDLVAAREHYAAALPLFRQGGDHRGTADALHNLGNVTRHLGDPEAARGLFEEALRLYRDDPDVRRAARSLHHLGALARDAGRTDVAHDHWREALALYEEAGATREAAEVRAGLVRPAEPPPGTP
jgi:tetratricopeptide (TPR) repeat protein